MYGRSRWESHGLCTRLRIRPDLRLGVPGRPLDPELDDGGGQRRRAGPRARTGDYARCGSLI